MLSTTDNETRRGLWLAGALMTGGMVAEVVATTFHPAREDPNDHPAVFAEYAGDDGWVIEHLAQFAAGLVIFAGLVALFRVVRAAAPRSVLPWLAFGTATAAVAAFAVLQAVDGVALKHAVDAWAAAPAGQRAAAFADAESVRALEWGANGFFRLLQGAAVALIGLAIARTSIAGRWLGALGAAAGAGYAATGVVVATRGFSPASLKLSLALDPLFLVFALAILVKGLRPRPLLASPRVPEAAR